jgi:hypothetical protein
MAVQPRRERPHVPERQLEKSIRMALERGRLADLLVGDGEGRGTRLLHRALRLICELPPAERALASEQLRSRFVDYLMASTLKRSRGRAGARSR